MPLRQATSNKSTNISNNLFEFNYSESTRVANSIATNEESKRKKMMSFNCDVKTRANAQKVKLQTKLKLQKRKALEKLVAEHHRKKALNQ